MEREEVRGLFKISEDGIKEINVEKWYNVGLNLSNICYLLHCDSLPCICDLSHFQPRLGEFYNLHCSS
ncbi:unnamed protein product [Gordionus sp. m RMFG-2023]